MTDTLVERLLSPARHSFGEDRREAASRIAELEGALKELFGWALMLDRGVRANLSMDGESPAITKARKALADNQSGKNAMRLNREQMR